MYSDPKLSRNHNIIYDAFSNMFTVKKKQITITSVELKSNYVNIQQTVYYFESKEKIPRNIFHAL